VVISRTAPLCIVSMYCNTQPILVTSWFPGLVYLTSQFPLLKFVIVAYYVGYKVDCLNKFLLEYYYCSCEYIS